MARCRGKRISSSSRRNEEEPANLDYQIVHIFASVARMKISVSDAKAQLTELVRRAEAGDEVILTRHGHAAVRLVPVARTPDAKARRTVLEVARASGRAQAASGPDAARSQDFLYGDDGLPG